MLDLILFQGSSFIMFHILRCPSRRKNTANQILVGISVFDGIGSMTFILYGVLAPASSGFYQSVGSDITCKLSGFLVQLGYTSMFYNMFLSIYYWLVINCGWTDRRLNKKRMFRIHALIVSIGLGMSIGTIRYSGPQIGYCYVMAPPFAKDWWPIRLFFTIPLSIALAVVTLCTIAVCYRVRKQIQASLRWSARQNASNSTQRRVFWRAFFYVLAFYVTMPFQFWAIDAQSIKYWTLALVALMAPSQGFMNCLVYIYKMQQSSANHQSNRNNTTNNNSIGAQLWMRPRSWICTNVTFCCCWHSNNPELSGTPIQLSSALHPPPSSHQGENHQAEQTNQEHAKKSSFNCDTRNKTPTSSRLDDDDDVVGGTPSESGDAERMEDEPIDGVSPKHNA